MKAIKLTLSAIALVAVTSCGDRDPTFSLLQETDVFFQNSTDVTNKLDILWVIDDSGSMANLQSNIASNFAAFINDFSTKGYDYRIAVTTTTAYYADPAYEFTFAYYNPLWAEFRGATPILTPSTPNIQSEFINNITVGTSGTGDERAFQSMEVALTSPLNSGFLRDDGFLAVIIVSDEDDFSRTPFTSGGESYSDPLLVPTSDYVDFLDDLTNSSGAQRRYSVSAVSILDSACLSANQPYGNIGQRYQELVALTDGVDGDVCSSNFAATLDEIQERIAELSTQFFLSREPILESIVVKVNGALIPQDPNNGWSYDSDANSIVFHGSAIPAQGAIISIDFDPVTVVQ